jgi:type IV pilus assembly protein PilN
MMIRINLLPQKQVKKRSQGSQVLAAGAAALLVAVAGNYYWYASRDGALVELERKNAALKTQIEEKKRVLKEVENIQARRDEVKKKLAVLQTLRDGRSGPVRMLDALAGALPANVWLHSLDQKGKGLRLTGSAATNEDVAEFMRSLSSVVWTPKGIGGLVEAPRAGAKTARVELASGDAGGVEEFPTTSIKPFFTNVDLKRSQARGQTERGAARSARLVQFDLSMAADYAN